MDSGLSYGYYAYFNPTPGQEGIYTINIQAYFTDYGTATLGQTEDYTLTITECYCYNIYYTAPTSSVLTYMLDPSSTTYQLGTYTNDIDCGYEVQATFTTDVDET